MGNLVRRDIDCPTAGSEVFKLNARAKADLAAGKLESAIAICHEAIKIDPGCGEAYQTLGQALQAQHKADAAVRAYRFALELDAGCAIARQSLSQILGESAGDVTFPNHLRWEGDQDLAHLIPYYYPTIDDLVAVNPNQMTVEEYRHIGDRISENAPGNLLVFGVGKDSALWMEINRNGKTVFLEDSQEWLVQVQNYCPKIEAYLVEYNTQRKDWAELLMRCDRGENCLFLDLPQWIYETSWDWILVDAPAGYTPDKPGRMKSIYTASKLAVQSGNTDVFVHDCDRTVEIAYTGYFFKRHHFVKQINNKLNHYKIVADS